MCSGPKLQCRLARPLHLTTAVPPPRRSQGPRHHRRRLAAALLGYVYSSAFVGAPSIVGTLPLLSASVLIGGVAVATWHVVTVSFRQRITPDHLLGCVNSFYRLLTWGTIPFGPLLGGTAGKVLGLQSMFMFDAAVAALPLTGLWWVNETTMRNEETAAPDR